jgi:regulator of sirC expression with transglutaminase-like and TPR domain
MQSKVYNKALGVIERMVIVSPGLPSLYQEKAWCHAQQHEYRLAIGALESYLEHAENAGSLADTKQVKDQINGLWASLSRLN